MLLRTQHASVAEEDRFDLEAVYLCEQNQRVKTDLMKYINNLAGIKICPDLLEKKIYGCFDYLRTKKRESPATAETRVVKRRRYTRRTSVRLSVL